MRNSIPKLTAVALAVAGLFCCTANAADVTWNSVTGSWSTAANWNPAAVPVATSNVIISVPGAQIITHDTGSSTINTLAIGTSTNTLLINGASAIGINNGGSNNGTIRVDGSGSALDFFGGATFNNTGGTINIINNGAIGLDAVNMVGGVLSSSAGGKFIAGNSNSNILNGVTLNGLLDMAGATGIERVSNGLTANGTVSINNNSVLSFSGDQTLGGNANILLGSMTANRVSIEGTSTLTLGANTQIHGQNGIVGQVYNVNGTPSIVNNGRISADVLGGLIDLSPTGGTTNGATLEALNGGTLRINSAVVNTGGGHIDAGNGSNVIQNGVTIDGGTINTSGTGKLTATNSNSNFLNGVTLNGTIDLSTATGIERIQNGLTLTSGSTISVNNNSVLSFSGDQTLGGNANILLGSTGASNRVSIEGTSTLTLGANTQIHGQNGTIGQVYNVNGTQSIVNNGRISADVAGGLIDLSPNGGTVNNGVIEAQNGGILRLNSSVASGVGSHLDAGAGSTVIQNGVAISGMVNVADTGSFTVTNNNANFLNGVSFNGNIDLASATSIERVTGGLPINGTVSINNNSVLSFIGDQTLSGNATILLGNTGTSNRVSIEGNSVLTLGSDVLIHGQNGTIGEVYFANGTPSVVNNGRISADVLGGTIVLTPNGGITNTSTLEAINGGTLLLNSVITNMGSGHIDAGTASKLIQNSVTINGGTINTSGTGKLTATNNNANILNGVTLNGQLDMATATNIERVTNGLTLNGTVNVNNNSILSFSGDQTLAGNANIVLGSTGTSNRVSIEGTSTLTIGTNTRIHGENGTVGQVYLTNGATAIINNGRIAADVVGGTITIAANSVVNNGVLLANGGTLNASAGFSGTGTAQVDGAGQFNIGAASTVGNLANNGTATSALNLGTHNITVSSDYTNASFGVGNAFDRRANVSGTGQILASGNVAQVITGTNVTGGTTANAVLTIGNVHVGDNTVLYQIANSGTNGPALRGAVQTIGGGANITDARLSGTGVTAGNYGPVAAGNSTGSLAVNFNAASAGALAPLSGQAVRIVSNFDNVSAQLLSIQAGATAAAYNLAQGNATPSPVTLANQRVGGTVSQTLTVANNAPSGSFTEGLNVGFGANTGSATNNNGAISLLAGGGTSTAMIVGVDTASAGAKSGAVTLNYVSDGTGTSGLGTTNVGSQLVNVSGNVYQAATGAIQTAALNFGTVQVGQSISQNLVIRNTATGAAGFVEDLNAAFGATSGTGANLISGSGSFSGILAGTNSSAGNGTMTVNVNTAAAGNINGAIGINYQTAGAVNGVSNSLGTASAGSENYGVVGAIEASGQVVNQASPLINTAQPINLGNVRINDTSPTASVSMSNQATTAPQAALNASISGNGPITGSGSFNLLAPGATDASSLRVGMNTATAGAINGTATIALVSDASNIGNCGANCQMTLASQSVQVSAAVYRLADPTLDTQTVTIAARVGDSVSANRSVTITNTSPDSYTEGLKVSIAGVSGNAQNNGGSIASLAAQLSDSSIKVGLASTAVAGTTTGQVALNLGSTGAGTTGASDYTLAQQVVNVAGKIYQQAVASVSTLALDFGIVHKGDSIAAQTISVTNSAQAAALNDVLKGSVSSINGPVTVSAGNLGNGLTAGASGNLTVVELNTGSAGLFSVDALLTLTSSDFDLTDISLDKTLKISGTVNNYARADILKTSPNGVGNLSRNGNTITLDLGSFMQNSGTVQTALETMNNVTGLSDLLKGSFALTSANGFSFGGFGDFSDLGAGGVDGLDIVYFDTSTLGAFTDQITLHAMGYNSSNYTDTQDLTLVLTANVLAGGTVPEPRTLALLAIALAALAFSRRRCLSRK